MYVPYSPVSLDIFYCLNSLLLYHTVTIHFIHSCFFIFIAQNTFLLGMPYGMTTLLKRVVKTIMKDEKAILNVGEC